MKVLYIHQYFNTPEMNGSTRSYSFANALSKAGHKTIVVTSNRLQSNSGLKITRPLKNLIVIWIPVEYSNNLSSAKRILSFIKFFVACTAVSLRVKSDLVFATSTPLTVAIPAIIYSVIKKVPFVFEVRDLWPRIPIALGYLSNPIFKFSAKGLERLAYYMSSQVIALSPDMEMGVKEILPKAKTVMIPNIASIDLFNGSVDDYPIPWLDQFSGKRLIIYTGTFGVVNDVGYIIRTAALLKHRLDLIFLLIGDGIEREKIIGLARDIGVLNVNVFFHDPVPKKYIPTIYAQAALALSLVAPIEVLWGNSANKYFDSLASGTPIAVNHKGWLAESIVDNRLGLVLPVNDYAGAANNIECFFNNSNMLEISRNCLELAMNEYSEIKLTKKFVSVLELTKRNYI